MRHCSAARQSPLTTDNIGQPQKTFLQLVPSFDATPVLHKLESPRVENAPEVGANVTEGEATRTSLLLQPTRPSDPRTKYSHPLSRHIPGKNAEDIAQQTKVESEPDKSATNIKPKTDEKNTSRCPNSSSLLLSGNPLSRCSDWRDIRETKWDIMEHMYDWHRNSMYSKRHYDERNWLNEHPLGARQDIAFLLKGMAMKTGVQGIPNLAHAQGKFFKGYWTIVVVVGLGK